MQQFGKVKNKKNMGRMRLSGGLMAIITAGMLLDNKHDVVRKTRNVNPEPNKNPNMNPYGLKKFIIDGEEIFAINLKNAKRKANKKLN